MTSNGPIESHTFKLIIQAVDSVNAHFGRVANSVDIAAAHIE